MCSIRCKKWRMAQLFVVIFGIGLIFKKSHYHPKIQLGYQNIATIFCLVNDKWVEDGEKLKVEIKNINLHNSIFDIDKFQIWNYNSF